jgi:hypothetical protein
MDRSVVEHDDDGSLTLAGFGAGFWAIAMIEFFQKGDEVGAALLHKSSDGRTSPSPGQTYPVTFVTGMPMAVKPFRTATRTWNSAT